MRNAQSVSRLALLTTLVFAVFCCLPAHAQKKKQKKGTMEEFEEVCPYTKGELALEKKLGYERVGFIPWHRGEDSRTIQEDIGGIPMVWAETKHFRIGSSLSTYKISKDKEEKKRLKEEVKRLESKIGRMKVNKKEIDPWLRLHLYAQMAEDLYAQFMEDFGLKEEDFAKTGPHLGHEKKFLLLLCQKESEYGRYLRLYENSDIENSYRTGWMNEGMLVTANFESLARDYKSGADSPTDTMFRCLIMACITSNFIDVYDNNLYRAPRWLAYCTSHIYQRRFDARWTRFDGRTIVYDENDDSWEWEPRVYNLVKNDFFISNKKMFQFQKYTDMNLRDHMIGWSKLKYLMEETDGSLGGFLSDVTTPAIGFEVPTQEEYLVMQTKALQDNFGMTPEEFDKVWSKWVLKTYPKR